ncbi:uncharacterized protein LOC141630547 [Silene latifolia]|uniref:uncharacterized protein LOC141630547 n=1 Tax=Silene latifolia TaxID=37657 RepID=UPI003D776678
MTGTIITTENKGSGSGKTTTIPMSSPLFLHPSDSPSLMLTQTIFDGDNYDLWADAVRNGLDAKNKLGFIEGKVKQPVITEGDEENVEGIAWRQSNAMVKAWLRNVINPKLHPSITFSGTVFEIWEELRERFSAGNAPRVHQLKADLTECKQGDLSVVEYYTQLKTIWDELSSYSRVPKCTCGAAAALLKEREEEKVHQFLMGLNSALYSNLRSNLLMEDTITTLSRAYSLVLREERHKAVTRIKEEKVEAAMTVKAQPSGMGREINGTNEQEESKPLQCSYCEKFYHDEDHCFVKHGFPPNWGRGRGRGGRRGGRGGGARGGRGRGQGNKVHANAVGTSGDAGQRSNDFTSDEVEKIRGLLSNSESNQKLKQGPMYEDDDWTG